MAVVCEHTKSAQYLRDHADKVHISIKEGKNRLSQWMAFENAEDRD